MKTTTWLVLIAILFLSITACETTEKIDDFPLRPSKLVVNCFFAEDSIWKFQVSNSLSVLDNADLTYVDNAEIILKKGGVLVDTITEQDQDGLYIMNNHLPESGEHYSIEVSAAKYTSTLLAEEFAPQKVLVSEVSLTIIDSIFWNGNVHSGGTVDGFFRISFSDPANFDNYYQLSIYSIDTMYNHEDSSDFYINQRDILFTNDDAGAEDNAGYNRNLLLTDHLFNGQSYQVKAEFHDWDAKRRKKYFIELTSMNRSGYLYRRSIDDYENAQGDPFAEPVQVYSNIENGYGIFAGFSKSTYEISMN